MPSQAANSASVLRAGNFSPAICRWEVCSSAFRTVGFAPHSVSPKTRRSRLRRSTFDRSRSSRRSSLSASQPVRQAISWGVQDNRHSSSVFGRSVIWVKNCQPDAAPLLAQLGAGTRLFVVGTCEDVKDSVSHRDGTSQYLWLTGAAPG